MNYFSEKQNQIIKYHPDGIIILSGNAITAKTATVFERAISLAEKTTDNIFLFTYSKQMERSLKSKIELREIEPGRIIIKTLHAYCYSILKSYAGKFNIAPDKDLNKSLKEIIIRKFGKISLINEGKKLSQYLERAYYGDFDPITQSLNLSEAKINTLLEMIAKAGIVSFSLLLAIGNWIILKSRENCFGHILIDEANFFDVNIITSLINRTERSVTIVVSESTDKLNDFFSSSLVQNRFGKPTYFCLDSDSLSISSIINEAVTYDDINSISKYVEEGIKGFSGSANNPVLVAVIKLPFYSREQFIEIRKLVDEWSDNNLSLLNSIHVEVSVFSVNSIKGMEFKRIIIILDEIIESDFEAISRQLYLCLIRSTNSPFIAVKASSKEDWVRVCSEIENTMTKTVPYNAH
jgi:hypothetical protein